MKTHLELVLEAIDKVKGEDVVIYDFQTHSAMVDQMVVVSGSSLRQVDAIAQNIERVLKENNVPIRAIEGDKGSSWILVDLYDIVVHVFSQEDRDIFKLEKLYSDMKRVDIPNV